MAQTTLNIYASDQLFKYEHLIIEHWSYSHGSIVSYFTRLLGTFIGAVIGLLSWYIGQHCDN